MAVHADKSGTDEHADKSTISYHKLHKSYSVYNSIYEETMQHLCVQ